MPRTTKTETKVEKTTENEYLRLKDITDDFCEKLENGCIWIKNGKFDPRVSIKYADGKYISDFVKCIELRNVYAQVVDNKKGYKTLVITSTDDLPF